VGFASGLRKQKQQSSGSGATMIYSVKAISSTLASMSCAKDAREVSTVSFLVSWFVHDSIASTTVQPMRKVRLDVASDGPSAVFLKKGKRKH
jgi:hypothetical protein